MRPERQASLRTEPPLSRLSRCLLGLLLNAEDRRAVLSDLAELYEHRCIRDGERAARGWLRRQMASFSLRLLADRLLRIDRKSTRLNSSH